MVIAVPGLVRGERRARSSISSRSPTTLPSGSAASGADSGSGTGLPGRAPYTIALVIRITRLTRPAAAAVSTVCTPRTLNARFGLPGDRDKDPDDSQQPSGAGQTPGAGGPFGALGPLGDPQQFADALRQFADLMAWKGGPVNWDLAKNVARHAVVAEGDPSVLDSQRHQVDEALRLADLWLGDATTFPSGIRSTRAWSRSEWVEATLPVWSKLCDPIAAKAVETMGGMFTMNTEELG